MEQVYDMIMMAVPAIIVFFTTFYILKKFFENEEKKRNMELRRNSLQSVMPIRLQAYERMILFLERISPENLVMRVHKNSMSVSYFQQALLQHIRTEYEHNIAQQTYISSGAWEMVKRAKEETIKLVNVAASKVSDESNGMALSKAIFSITAEIEKKPTQIAIEFLKKEVRKLF